MKKTNTKFVLTALCFFVLIIAIVYVGLTSPKKTYSACTGATVNGQCCNGNPQTSYSLPCVNSGVQLTLPGNCGKCSNGECTKCIDEQNSSYCLQQGVPGGHVIKVLKYSDCEVDSTPNCSTTQYYNGSNCVSCGTGATSDGGTDTTCTCTDSSNDWKATASGGECVAKSTEENCPGGKIISNECYECIGRTGFGNYYRWCKKNNNAECTSDSYTDDKCTNKSGGSADETPSCSFKNASVSSGNILTGKVASTSTQFTPVNSNSSDYDFSYTGDTRYFTHTDSTLTFTGATTVGTYKLNVKATHKTNTSVTCSMTYTVNVVSSTSGCDNVNEFDTDTQCKAAASSKCGTGSYDGCSNTTKNANGCYVYQCTGGITCTLADGAADIVEGHEGTLNLTFTPASGFVESDYTFTVAYGDCSVNGTKVTFPSSKAVTGGVNPKICRVTATHKDGKSSCTSSISFNIHKEGESTKKCCKINSGTYVNKYYWCDKSDCSCDTSSLTSSQVYKYAACVNEEDIKNCTFTNGKSAGYEYIAYNQTKTFNIKSSSTSNITSCISGGKNGTISGNVCNITVTKNDSTSQYVDVNITNADGSQDHCLYKLFLLSSNSSKCEVSIKGNAAIAQNTVTIGDYSAVVARPSQVDPDATIKYKWTASGTAFGSISNDTSLTTHVTSKAVSSGTISLKVEISFEKTGKDYSSNGCSTTTSVVVSSSAKYQCWECNDGNNYWVPETTSPSQAAQYAGLGSNYTCNQPRTNLTTKSACVGSGGGSSSGGGYNPPASESQYIPPSPSSEKTPDNPKTGPELIYLVWGIGILMIGYSMWYFKNGVREN